MKVLLFIFSAVVFGALVYLFIGTEWGLRRLGTFLGSTGLQGGG